MIAADVNTFFNADQGNDTLLGGTGNDTFWAATGTIRSSAERGWTSCTADWAGQLRSQSAGRLELGQHQRLRDRDGQVPGSTAAS